MAKEDVQKKLKDGKIEQVKSKREREEESLIQVGARKKGGKKPKQKHQAEEDETDVFSNIDISLINLFGFLKISPPLNKASLEPKIKELTEKIEFFQKEG